VEKTTWGSYFPSVFVDGKHVLMRNTLCLDGVMLAFYTIFSWSDARNYCNGCQRHSNWFDSWERGTGLWECPIISVYEVCPEYLVSDIKNKQRCLNKCSNVPNKTESHVKIASRTSKKSTILNPHIKSTQVLYRS
jgi:hypothetical protein